MGLFNPSATSMAHIISTSRNRGAYWAEVLYILLIVTRWYIKSSHWSDGSFQRRKIKAEKKKGDRTLSSMLKWTALKALLLCLGSSLKPW